MSKILIATGNQGKFSEMMEVLRDVEFEMGKKFVSLRDLEITAEAEEDGQTFEENALKKAKFFYDLHGAGPVIAEDSGILVDALPGELGVQTRRWGAGVKANDEEWIKFFLERMRVVPTNERGASFVCCTVFYDGKEPIFFHGKTEGVITNDLQAPIKSGLPLSSCFIPRGYFEVYAALSEEEKNRISHRGKALHALKAFLLNMQTPSQES